MQTGLSSGLVSSPRYLVMHMQICKYANMQLIMYVQIYTACAYADCSSLCACKYPKLRSLISRILDKGSSTPVCVCVCVYKCVRQCMYT